MQKCLLYYLPRKMNKSNRSPLEKPILGKPIRINWSDIIILTPVSLSDNKSGPDYQAVKWYRKIMAELIVKGLGAIWQICFFLIFFLLMVNFLPLQNFRIKTFEKNTQKRSIHFWSTKFLVDKFLVDIFSQKIIFGWHFFDR